LRINHFSLVDTHYWINWINTYYFGTVLNSRFNVDVVNWSITNILDNSVASSDSEESLAFLTSPWLNVFGLDWKFGLHFLLLLNIAKFVEELFLLKFSVFQEHIKCGLAKWNNVFKNVPKDTLGEWCSSEWTGVGPSPVELKQLNEFGKIQWWSFVAVFGLGFLEHLSHVSIMEIGLSVKSVWEVIRNSLKEET